MEAITSQSLNPCQPLASEAHSLTHSLSGPLWDFHLEPNKDQLLERMRENGARCKKRRIVTANLFRK